MGRSRRLRPGTYQILEWTVHRLLLHKLVKVSHRSISKSRSMNRDTCAMHSSDLLSSCRSFPQKTESAGALGESHDLTSSYDEIDADHFNGPIADLQTLVSHSIQYPIRFTEENQPNMYSGRTTVKTFAFLMG
jgi:hypothetical protein